MAAPVKVEASSQQLRILAELRAQKAALDAKRMAELDVFALIGHEPNCLPRHAARKRVMAKMGIADFRDSRLAEPGVLPEYCGKCPQEQFHSATEADVLYGGASGGGKGGRCPDRTSPSYDVSMETRVLTPKGFKLIGDIAIGDQVCNPDGTVAHVVRVTDNGLKQFFKVTLADGSSVEADEDHLWAVTVSGARRARKHDLPVIPAGLRPQDEWNLRVMTRCWVVTTVQLREMVIRAAGDKSRGERPRYVLLPLMMPARMTGAQGRWPVLSPYILGAIVGDGSSLTRSVVITAEDEEIFARVRAELPSGLALAPVRNRAGCPAYRIIRRDGTTEGPPAAQAQFAAEVRKRREAADLDQRALAALAGMNQAYLSLIERCQKWPGRKIADRLDEALGAGGDLAALHTTRTEESGHALLSRDGLAGLNSWEKFIPQRIKVGTIEDRFAFIQGLFDTDGYMDDRGHVEFVTTSERLALDTQEVLRSLGCRATLTTKTPTYMHEGEKKAGRLAYRLYVQGRHLDRLFHLSRKRERVMPYNGGDVEPWHRVVSVEPSGTDNSRCIQVDNLNHLYVTDDYIVTHNSHAITAEGIKWCARYPGLRVLLVRKSYDELEESIFPALRKFGYAKALGAKWNGVKNELRFPNGSYFRFRYLETVDDAARRQGGEYQLLLVDELALMMPGVVDILRYERLRSAGGLPVIGVRATSNPGGPDHGGVKKRYVEATEDGTKVATDEFGLTIRFIKARATDNPHLDPMQRKRLDAIPDPNRRAAMRDGDWGTFSGAVFPQFSKERHTLDSFALPASWNRYNGVDWGYTAPFAVLWGAVDEDDRLWIYRELYARQVGEADQARMILAAEDGEHVIARWADDAMWATRGDAKPIADIYADNGVRLTPSGKGPGSRVTGLQRWHTYLAEGPACPHHRSLGWKSCPRVHIFRNCPNLIAELESLPYATKGNTEDSDPKAPDHAYDAGRYLLLNIGGGATFYDSPEPPARGPGELLTPMGAWAVREDPAVTAARAAADPETRPGAVQLSPFA